MKPKHFLLHLVRHHSKSQLKPLHEELREHLQKSLSKEQVTASIKKRLLEKRRRDALHEELRALEHQLLQLRDVQEDRVRALREKIAHLKKNVERV